MAVVTGPLLSISARGSIAKTQVYAKWKGRPYVRQHVIPANPQSTEQSVTRNCFSWLNSVWKVSPAEFQEAWTAFASGKVLTNRNAFIQQDLKILRGNANLDGMILSPGARGGLVGSLAVTPGATQLSLTLTPPGTLPTGWTILEAIFALIEDQSPETGVLYNITADTVAAPGPYTKVFTGLTTAQDYQVGAWLKYQTSSLATDLAYGPSTAVVGTPT